MKPNLHSLGTALLAAITLFTTAARASAQTGPGFALSFNGTNAYVAVDAQYVPIYNSPYTIEAWIRANSMGNYGIIGWGNYGTTNQVNALSLRTNGLANSWWGNDLVVTNAGLAGAWHHVAATFDGTWRKIYVDGALVASNSPSGTHAVPNVTSLSIGLVGVSDYFNGTIDEVRLWNLARTQTQIQSNRFTRLTGSESGLNAYWKFDEGSGPNAADAFDGNDGTLTNNPVWVRSTAPFAPEAATTNATAITTASARLNGRVHAGNLAAKAWFQWGTTASYGTNTPQISVGPDLPADTNALSFEIGSVLTNLTFNTTYHFRVAVTNSAGTNYGSDAVFTTAPLPTGPGCALSFDGTNDYVQAGSAPLANSSFTIEAWARRASANANDLILGQGYYDTDLGLMFGFSIASSNAFLFGFYYDDLVTTNHYTDNDWHHWAGTYDTATKARRVYRDGVLVAADTAAANYQGSGPIVIGDAIWHGNVFHGELDEVRIWNVARSQAQLQANLYRPLAGNEPGLLAYWQFDECSGTLAADTTGHGYDGTLIGVPTWANSTVHYGPAVATLPATNLTTTSATLTGTAHPQGFATTAWFQWGTTTNYGGTTTVTNVGSGTNTVAISTNITGLASFSTYHFRAVATNSYGVSYGADQSFWLGTPLVTTLPASDITTNAATINSTVIPSGPSAYAWFQWGLTTNYGNVTVVSNVGSGSIPISVTNRLQPLVSGSTYHYRVVATNMFGASLGDDQAFTTPFFGQITTLAGAPLNGLAWGDFDNDGDLDIVVTGTLPTTKIYRNDGNGVFTEVSVPLTALGYSSIAVGDYDNDGWLDLLLMGMATGPSGITEIWRNTGTGWIKTNAPLPGVYHGSAAWGDFDNDGRLDILLTGYTGSNCLAQVWRNTGSGWSNINAALPGVYYSSAAWGDYDNDGRLDILLTGWSDTLGSIARVYHNNGNGTFTDINAGLPGFSYSSAAWGDFDNDGRLDILLAGTTNGSSSGAISRVYHNDGDGTFTDIHAGLAGTFVSSVAWGDFDNDGCLDILLTGSSDTGAIARVYRNNGDGTFTAIPTAGLIDAYNPAVAVGDYDKDGRLDILISDSSYVTRLYRNYWPATNNPPTAPANLVASVAGTNALLTWTLAGDPQTPSPGLSYNLRVGTSPGGSNVVSPQAAANGFRRVPQLGNMQQNLSTWLTGLNYGSNYHWSVQAVDAAFAGSPFATEGSFAVTRAPSATSVQVGSVMGNSAVISASVYPNGTSTTAYIQWGTTASYGNSTAVTNVGSGTAPASLRQILTGLQPGKWYHYRVVTSNANGTTYGADQTFWVDPAVLLGDADGDGVVEQSELDAVLAGYWPTSPWLYMTNTAGLGGTNVTFALTNSTAGAYSVWMSTNLMVWDYLGPATPRYEFTDTNAPAMPQRFYRLSWP